MVISHQTQQTWLGHACCNHQNCIDYRHSSNAFFGHGLLKYKDQWTSHSQNRILSLKHRGHCPAITFDMYLWTHAGSREHVSNMELVFCPAHTASLHSARHPQSLCDPSQWDLQAAMVCFASAQIVAGITITALQSPAVHLLFECRQRHKQNNSLCAG